MITKEETVQCQEYKRIIRYQLQQNPDGIMWTAVTYPGDEEETRQSYTNYVKDFPGTKFRIIKIETIRSIILE